MPRINTPTVMLALPLLWLAACSSSETPSDAGAVPTDTGVEAPDAGTPDVGAPDAGEVEPTICDELGLRALPFQEGTGLEFGDVAGDFTITDLYFGEWNFRERYTGCESYVFLSYSPDNAGEEFWSSEVRPLVEAPITTHFFFIAQDFNANRRMQKLEDIAVRVNAVVYEISDEAERNRQFARFHYVIDDLIDASLGQGGSLGELLRDYRLYRADSDNYVDLGDRGQAPPPPLVAFGIDRDQRWDSGGSMTRFVGGPQAIQMASYLPLFYDHKARIRDAQAAETGVETIVLLEDRVTDRVFDVDATLPSAAELEAYDTLEVDVTVNCPHRNVFACSEWDRIAHVWVCEDAECMSRKELVRWITPYWRRGERRWVMDASALMALVKDGGAQRFRIEMGPSWERATERDVRVALRLSNQSKGSRMVGADYAFGGGNFNEEYNTREPFSFTPPATATKVELVVILSGHGQAGNTNCSEWCDHRHQFAVNGTDLEEIRHEGQIGSEGGCGPAAARGVSPGQYGNWAPERAYWCPGLPVDHIVVDITDRVTLGQANELTYSANYRGGAPGGGNISLSSYVVWSE